MKFIFKYKLDLKKILITPGLTVSTRQAVRTNYLIDDFVKTNT